MTVSPAPAPAPASASSFSAAPRPSQIYRPDLLRGQRVLVTGGGSGIGYAIAEECARLGARVHIGGRDEGRLNTALEGLRAAAEGAGGDPSAVSAAPLNIREEERCEEWVGAAAERLGGLDALVNNAGGQFPSPAEHIKPKGWRAVIDTNLNGTFFMSQAAGRRMMRQGGGQVVNIIANMWRGFPGMAHTGAARAGVENLTKTLALEWAKHHIRVNAVAPGVIRSSGLSTYPESVRAMLEREVPSQIPLGRLGEVEDVAWAVVYLLSPAGRYVTGETLCVDGGQAHWGTVFPVR